MIAAPAAGPLPEPGAPDLDGRSLDLAWLRRLRWSAIAGQAATIALVAALLPVTLPLAPLGAILAAQVASAVVGHRLLVRRPDLAARLVPWLSVVDLVALTGLLAFTGGPENPFNFLYLVHVALAAVLLPARWAWGLAGLSVALGALLFVAHVPLAWTGAGGEHAHHGHGPDAMRWHLQGMWVALVVAAVFIVTFVRRIRAALAAREAELARARADAARSSRLASLATLAAGAAHELATPLSTIAVVARELEDQLEELGVADAADDARLVRREVARCRAVLDGLAADAGEPAGDEVAAVSVEALAAGGMGLLPEAARARLVVEVGGDGAARVATWPRLVGRALAAVLDNALAASPEGSPVLLRAALEGDRVRLSVDDAGPGIPPELRERVTEPFFTTKAPGRGMGLGLFVARTICDRLGGTLEIGDAPGGDGRPGGARVTLVLPAGAPAGPRPGRRGAR